MHNLSIINSLIGGCLIGLSAVLLLWLFGRLAGISGIIHGLIPPTRKDIGWRVWFILGMITASIAYHLIPAVHFEFRHSYPIYLSLIAGICVGFGTRMGSGCTSGHGVCGMARLSPRSIVATLIFILFGVITVFILRHLL